MKEIRRFLDAMSEARSLADVNIAAGAALPVISKLARRFVAVLALTLLVTTAALAHGYTQLDHKLKKADKQHRVMLTNITRTTKKQQRVMVTRIVRANRERERLATEVSDLREFQPTAPLTASGRPVPAIGGAQNAVLVNPGQGPTATAVPASTAAEDAPPAVVEPAPAAEQPQPPPPPPPPTASSPAPPPPPPPPPAAPAPSPPSPPPPAAAPPAVAGPGVVSSPPPVAGPTPPPVSEPADGEPTTDPVVGIGAGVGG
jgi:hypothetical protein